MHRANDKKPSNKPLAVKIPVMLSSLKRAGKGATAYISNDKLLVRTSVTFDPDEIVQVRMKLPDGQVLILPTQAIFARSDEEGPTVALRLSGSGDAEKKWRACVAKAQRAGVKPPPVPAAATVVEEFVIKPNAPDGEEWNAGALGAISFDEGGAEMDIGSLLQNNNEPLSFENVR